MHTQNCRDRESYASTVFLGILCAYVCVWGGGFLIWWRRLDQETGSIPHHSSACQTVLLFLSLEYLITNCFLNTLIFYLMFQPQSSCCHLYYFACYEKAAGIRKFDLNVNFKISLSLSLSSKHAVKHTQ